MRVFSYLSLATALALGAVDARAQWPGEVHGVVVDVLSGRPVPHARVRLDDRTSAGVVDGAGRFGVRGLEAGVYDLRVQAPSYLTLERSIRVENGQVLDLRLELLPDVVEVEGVVAAVGSDGPGSAEGGWVLDESRIRTLVARSAGDVVRQLPGVQVTSRGRGSAETPSIRGSPGDAVLVLLDGVPLNDPVTGEADLSTISASSLSAVRVLPGGRSARYGSRAEAGVIVMETGAGGHETWELGGGVGALGEKEVDAGYRQALPLGTLALGGGLRRLDGGFEFELPEAAGGGRDTRRNAHVRGEEARLDWSGAGSGRRFRLAFGGERLERGLPGRSFAPSPTGEQELERGRLAGTLDLSGEGGRLLTFSGYLSGQRTRHRDPSPPLGAPFEEETRVRAAGLDLSGSARIGGRTEVSAGLAASYLRVRSTQLEQGMGRSVRWDRGFWLSATVEPTRGTTLGATVRRDRSGLPSRGFWSHDLSAAWSRGGLTLRAGHRSSFSPPTLGDQFFREGVGVAPNPDLEAERVPSEWTFGASLNGPLGPAHATFGVDAYRADIEGMIVWLPDFRFVWSPRNQDVRRRGVDVHADLRFPDAGIELSSRVAVNRATYVRPGSEDVQIVYRPLLSGGGRVSWSSEGWRASAASEYTGSRFPVPNRVNELPGFWTTDLAIARRWRTDVGRIETTLEVERLFDHDDTLIFAFPDPGRTLRLSVRIGG